MFGGHNSIVETQKVIQMQIRVTDDQQADILRAAFAHCHDPKDWKAPIDCLVHWQMANIYMAAISFMTGVTPTYEKIGDYCRLTCVGYRNGPAGG